MSEAADPPWPCRHRAPGGPRRRRRRQATAAAARCAQLNLVLEVVTGGLVELWAHKLRSLLTLNLLMLGRLRAGGDDLGARRRHGQGVDRLRRHELGRHPRAGRPRTPRPPRTRSASR